MAKKEEVKIDMSTQEGKLKALQAAMSKIEKDFGKGSIMKLGEEKIDNVEVIPTGSIGLNAALGVGGYPKGRIIEIYGPESSGKTTLAIHAIAEAQKAGGIAAFIDAEHAFDRFYAEKLTQTTLRNIIGELELDETLTSRDTINTKLRAVLDDATDKWGVKVNRVELQDIVPPATVLNAMEKQMQAERNKRAQILTSEGEKAAEILASEGEKTAIINRADAQKQQAILHAEGEAQARIRKAEAEAKAIELITEAVGKSTNPANYLLAQKYIQMMQELAQGDKTKTVYLPYEATNLLGSIGGIKDLFKSE